MGNIMIDDALAKKVNDVQNEFNRRLYHHVQQKDILYGPPLFFRMIHDSNKDLLEF
jgi:hypothetical protein